MKGTLNGILDIGYGQHILTIQTSDDCSKISKLKDKVIDFTVNLFKPKRSRNANNYLWVICDKIAKAINNTSVYVYRDAILNTAEPTDYPDLTEEQCNTLEDAWSRLGIGWISQRIDFEPDGDHIFLRCYKGSSTYDRNQMAVLIDYIVQEAKELDIQTDTNKIASLLDDWDKLKE